MHMNVLHLDNRMIVLHLDIHMMVLHLDTHLMILHLDTYKIVLHLNIYMMVLHLDKHMMVLLLEIHMMVLHMVQIILSMSKISSFTFNRIASLYSPFTGILNCLRASKNLPIYIQHSSYNYIEEPSSLLPTTIDLFVMYSLLINQ